MSAFLVGGVLRAVMAHGIHFVGWMVDATMLVCQVYVIFRRHVLGMGQVPFNWLDNNSRSGKSKRTQIRYNVPMDPTEVPLYNGLYGRLPPGGGTFFRVQVSLIPSRPRRFRMWRHLPSLSGITRVARTDLGTRLCSGKRVRISLVEGSTSFSGKREPWEWGWLKDMKG